MVQTLINIKKADGTYKTLDELKSEAIEYITDELDSMNEDDALDLGNIIRDNAGYETLYKKNEENVNRELSDWEPWDLLTFDWDDYSDYFLMDYGEPSFTDDVWCDLAISEIAEDIIIRGELYDELPFDLKCYVDEYNEAVEKLNNLNPIRALGNELLTRFVNCEADVTDLLQFIDKLIRDEQFWEE